MALGPSSIRDFFGGKRTFERYELRARRGFRWSEGRTLYSLFLINRTETLRNSELSSELRTVAISRLALVFSRKGTNERSNRNCGVRGGTLIDLPRRKDRLPGHSRRSRVSQSGVGSIGSRHDTRDLIDISVCPEKNRLPQGRAALRSEG